MKISNQIKRLSAEYLKFTEDIRLFVLYTTFLFPFTKDLTVAFENKGRS